MEEKTMKIITLGPSSVGKTSIIERIINRKFDINEKPTVGFVVKSIKKFYKKKNLSITYEFFDTSGQEKFMNLLPKSYIRNSKIVLLVFDSLNTLEVLKGRWFSFYKDNCSIETSKFIVIANKSDIFGDNDEDIRELGREFADEIDAPFLTCSAKSNDNIENIFSNIQTEVQRLIKEENESYESNENFYLSPATIQVSTQKSCC